MYVYVCSILYNLYIYIASHICTCIHPCVYQYKCYTNRGAGILAAPRDPLRLPAEEDTALHLMADMEPFVI